MHVLRGLVSPTVVAAAPEMISGPEVMQMTRFRGWSAGLVAILSILTPNIATAQLMSTCAADSPERRGQIGCTGFPSKPLPEGLTEPVFWHIDRFDSADRARAAVGSTSIAFDA